MTYAFLQVASVTLDPGVPTPVVFALTAALFVAGNGSQAQPFSVQAGDKGATRTVVFTPTADGTVTTLTADLQSSADGGATWSVYPGGGFATMILSALAQITVSGLVAGLLYRLNPHTLSLGSATKVTVLASAS